MKAKVFKADDDISPIEARLRKAFGGAVRDFNRFVCCFKRF